MKIRENIPLSSLTTMRFGGPARFLIDVETEADIPAAFNFAREKNLPVFVLGGGANTIAHDEGFPGVIIRNSITGITHAVAKDGQSLLHDDIADLYFLRVMGGTPWDDVVKYSVDLGLTGIEALSKIPGLAGAAPVQNIGAYGQDISQVLTEVRVYDIKNQTFTTLHHFELGFTYRHSILNTSASGRYFVISITLELRQGQMPRPFYNSIEKYITEHDLSDFSPASLRKIVSQIRADKLPDPAKIPSAGSFFKNVYLTEDEAKIAEQNQIPVYRGHDGLKINSGWLIEACGFKGQLLHGFRVNDKAALVLINESAKSYADLAAARAEIREKVKQKFGYELEQEPVELVTRTGDTAWGLSVGEDAPSGPVRRSKVKSLDGSELAGYIKARQAREVAGLAIKPHLLIIRDSENPVIMKYVTLKKAYGADIGVKVSDLFANTPEKIAAAIESANNDDNIHGIILQLPLVDKEKTDALTSLIAPEKDVDGLSGTGIFDSATATAIHWLLTGYDIDLKNQKIAIVGRGKLVGAPLFEMWTTSNYDVTLFHRGDDLTKLKKFAIIVTATGVPGLISDDFVSPGTVLVDAGTASEGGVLKGDLADALRDRPDLKAITPRLGGVGPLTVTCLFDHTITAAKNATNQN